MFPLTFLLFFHPGWQWWYGKMNKMIWIVFNLENKCHSLIRQAYLDHSWYSHTGNVMQLNPKSTFWRVWVFACLFILNPFLVFCCGEPTMKCPWKKNYYSSSRLHIIEYSAKKIKCVPHLKSVGKWIWNTSVSIRLSTQFKFSVEALYEKKLSGIPRLTNDRTILVKVQIYWV